MVEIRGGGEDGGDKGRGVKMVGTHKCLQQF